MRLRFVVVAWTVAAACAGGCAAMLGRASQGASAEVTDTERAAMTRIGQKIKGRIVWSSSREGNHDLFLMGTDGSGLTRLTRSDRVDWFPRFSQDGRTILFTRSRKGWVAERDCNMSWKWDIYTVSVDGGDEKLRIRDASWGTWIADGEILFSRGTKVFSASLKSGEEKLLVDSEKDQALGGAELQQPQLSPDGKYLALTLRGSRRATGIFDLAGRTWLATGEGCQINWHPSGQRIYWVNPSGNGGSEVLSVEVSEGKPVRKYEFAEMRFIDIPGRRSHEYFPQMTRDGEWLVWAATQRGHDHDIADYEIYIWEVGAQPGEATRLTFHSGNDRWPDIHVAETSP